MYIYTHLLYYWTMYIFFCNSSQLWVCCTEAHKYRAKGRICQSSIGKINAHQTCTPTERNTVEPLFKLPLNEHLVNCTVNQGPAKSVISKMHISKLFSCRIIITVIIMGNSFFFKEREREREREREKGYSLTQVKLIVLYKTTRQKPHSHTFQQTEL